MLKEITAETIKIYIYHSFYLFIRHLLLTIWKISLCIVRNKRQ